MPTPKPASPTLPLRTPQPHVNTPSNLIHQFPITRQPSLRQTCPINPIKFLQQSNSDIRDFREGELLAYTYSWTGVEWEIVESKFTTFPAVGAEGGGVGTPVFGEGVDCPELEGGG